MHNCIATVQDLCCTAHIYDTTFMHGPVCCYIRVYMQAGMRTGIMGIERNIEKKQRETGREVSQV